MTFDYFWRASSILNLLNGLLKFKKVSYVHFWDIICSFMIYYLIKCCLAFLLKERERTTVLLFGLWIMMRLAPLYWKNEWDYNNLSALETSFAREVSSVWAFYYYEVNREALVFKQLWIVLIATTHNKLIPPYNSINEWIEWCFDWAAGVRCVIS